MIHPCPKPPSRLTDRVQDKRERDAQDRAFRAKVWQRDESRCQRCDRRVRRTLECVPEQGHVHHKRGRNVAPDDRWNPEAAELVCRVCHQRIHAGQATD